jgi:hypothetical protein
MAVGVVVSQLRMADGITRIQHRYALGQQQHGQQIPLLLGAQSLDVGIIRRTLGSAIPAEIIVVAIPILFAVGFIVFFVVSDQILQGEAVMRGDKIDAGIVLEQHSRTGSSSHQTSSERQACFREFQAARRTIQGYEAVHMIRKGQVRLRRPVSTAVAQRPFLLTVGDRGPVDRRQVGVDHPRLGMASVAERLAKEPLDSIGVTERTAQSMRVQDYGPELEQRLRPHLKPTNKSRRVDETYVRMKGRWVLLVSGHRLQGSHHRFLAVSCWRSAVSMSITQRSAAI